MRVKQIWDFVPLPAKAKLVWERLTFSRLTTVYIIFSLVHFVLQISLQIDAFIINADAATLLYSIALQGHATNNSFPALVGPEIRMCADVPINLSTANCTVVWDGVSPTNNSVYGNPPAPNFAAAGYSAPAFSASAASSVPIAAPSSSLSAAPSASSLSATPSASSAASSASVSASASAADLAHTTVFVTKVVVTTTIGTSSAAKPTASSANIINLGDDDDDDDDEEEDHEDRRRTVATAHVRIFESNDTVQVNITGMGVFNNYPLILDRSCMWSLNWPVSVLDNTKREDIVFIAFQFWVLGMSIVALLNESIPHIIASLLTHMLATGWSGFQIWHTADFHANFNKYITQGACHGVGVPSLLPNYWTARAHAEIPTLALNVVALLISCVLTWKLVKLFGWQTFKRVGASLAINRVYKLVLVLSITLQLSLFFMGVTVSLFLDQLFNGLVGQHAWYSMLYKVMFIITAMLLIPWLMMGWFSVRRELRLGMIAFLGLSILYLAGWGVMFLSTTFRWTFLTWSFFSIMSSASVFLTLTSFLLGVICRYNFGKGLLRYLNAQEALPGDDFEPITHGDDIEKVSFPSNEKAVPTFSATFGSGSEVPVPSQMFRPSPQLGPRFFNQSAEPFDSRSNSSNSSPISQPMAALTRTSSKDSYQSAATAMPNRRDSDRSFGSLNSYYDYSSGDSNHSRQDSETTGPTVGGNSKRWVIE
ncbi:hypothetical protein B0H17DRAFT_1168805 [Mycena rosella]|uniref:Uncharacterized protein n=1 Tax=Mycena rosella TaxID=1033263 RepID=A0AAD7DMB3_MYCRO|nr:hypothetical protein B0H17DRAFT_1168805 [Mycena rosella]